MARHKASIVGIFGASGSGKSTAIKQSLRRRPARLLIWDPMREYASFGQVVHTATAALAAMRNDDQPARRFSVVVQPAGDRKTVAALFDVVCQLAMWAGDCTLVVEELALVTSPSYAPPGWQAVTLRGRHQALRVIAASQRPASVDKDFFGNATVIRCGRLNYRRDRQVMADVLDVSPDALLELPQLAYLERDMTTGTRKKGTVTPAK